MPSLMEYLEKESLLNVSLRGLQAVLQREVGIHGLSYVFNDEFKQELYQREQSKGEAIAYPYGYLLVTEIAPDKDRNAFKLVNKHGLRMGTTDVTFSTSKKAYLYPAHVGLELHYFESDPVKGFLAAQALLLLTGMSAFTFDIKLGSQFKYVNSVSFLDSVSIPIAEINNPQNPGAVELTLQMVLNTQIGFLQDVAAVNSGTPTVTSFTVSMTNDRGESYEIEDRIVRGK